MKEAIDLLEPLTKDRVDHVRQGALIALSMVLIQHNETKEPMVKKLRKLFVDSLGRKGDTMTKLGAILGAGILDAGGRNVTISLLSPAGHKRMAAIVGMAIFPQFWYWYPDVHFLSLAFTPTAVIGLNKNHEMPEPFTFISNAKPSEFAYPSRIVITTEEEKKPIKHATLSVTAKLKAKAKRKENQGGDDSAMDTSEGEENKEKEKEKDDKTKKIGRAVQQECRDRSRMPSSA
eukprot:TRINITY_DN22016_c0_g1_i8.p1 TRINITY_DN22016_c0_g1~~TRINITY_DN22016_c0_g1_i8.p1  ORF type:complete len:233 (-),score=48.07 TRINITY_DN22016_c0_g1_i8:19-717(-)